MDFTAKGPNMCRRLLINLIQPSKQQHLQLLNTENSFNPDYYILNDAFPSSIVMHQVERWIGLENLAQTTQSIISTAASDHVISNIPHFYLTTKVSQIIYYGS